MANEESNQRDFNDNVETNIFKDSEGLTHIHTRRINDNGDGLVTVINDERITN